MIKGQTLLTKEDFQTRSDLPSWLYVEYETFHQTVTDKTFPCFFGMSGELKGELRYTFISQDDWSNLPSALEQFLALFEKPDYKRHGLFVFVEPFEKEGALDDYRKQFWDILQYLHTMDQQEWPETSPRDPDHYLWDFHFAGEPIFAFGNAPAYKLFELVNAEKKADVATPRSYADYTVSVEEAALPNGVTCTRKV